MRHDSIFYKLKQQSPTLLFELLPDPPPDNAADYRFDSVAIKEPRFEQLSRAEIEVMLDITLQETQLYRDIFDGKNEGQNRANGE